MQMDLKKAAALDEKDELAHFRNEFYLKKDVIYLDGNSLGLPSKRAEAALISMLDAWKEYGIDGWTQGEKPWYTLSETLGEQSAFLIGAKSDEVVVTGSTTVNLHQLAASFFHPEKKRTKILADDLNFPSDIYALQSQLSLRGLDPNVHLVKAKSRDGHTLEEDDIIACMTNEIALVVLPTVLYRSGQLLNIEKLTKAARDRGILIGFDGCHSVGAVPHEFHKWGVDFAYWCNYKYLNGGPGASAGLFVHEKHLGKMPGLSGWFGSNKESQFDMDHSFTPAASAGAYQIGTPHIFSTAPLSASLQLFKEATLSAIRKKSLNMTRIMMDLIDSELSGFAFRIINPAEDDRRGGHVALQHPEAARICKALKQAGVIPDYRSPNIIRLAPVALYTSYEELWKTIQFLKDIMREKRYEQYENKREVIA
ncbi:MULTISPECIES: kynureninase [Metabacillus]|uniref:Kynureninase n=1 Tax=Metabacillus hrfriensis TaxID=3048891 RepID=A0ACD4R9J7_9BACI|nr:MULTISPECIES: kynureninase [Metabacillus]UAL51607.1 kynureninase [Metabacillus dongyingensis]WHZ57121.1 kynureninase [Metabacillus sp. CT-WN-B3]